MYLRSTLHLSFQQYSIIDLPITVFVIAQPKANTNSLHRCDVFAVFKVNTLLTQYIICYDHGQTNHSDVLHTAVQFRFVHYNHFFCIMGKNIFIPADHILPEYST